MSIDVEQVTKMYGAQKALDNVGFKVKKGEIVGFLGPNGAGKSTMMKIITCYLPQTTGKVSICGFDVSESSMEVRKRVGYLPEHNPLYTEMYVKEYLFFLGGVHKIDKLSSKINKMISLVGLDREKHKKIGSLSKGYRQRVGLAQAMLHEPEVLILDEPTSGLDPNQLIEIRSLIQEIGKEKTVLMSTHIMQEVEHICDRVIIINKGKIVTDEQTANLRQQKSGLDSFIVEFSENISENLIRGIGEIDSITLVGTGKYKIVASKDIREQIFKLAVQQNVSVLTIQKEENSMEKIFKELTQ